MTDLTSRRKIRKNAIDRLKNIDQSAVLIIHYSCERFHDRIGGESPRITSIAIRNLRTTQTVSFAIHKIAEKNKINLNSAESSYNYDRLEKDMLNEFYDYAKSHKNYTWVHWNMRDANYGFEAIKHRFQVLGGEAMEFPEKNLYDFANSMKDLYGPNYVRKHPRLNVLRDLNQISDKDFMEGAAEAKAFEDGEFYKMHLSTLRKVDVIASLFELVVSGNIVTESTRSEIYGGWVDYIKAMIKDNILGSIISFLAAMITIIGFVWRVFK